MTRRSEFALGALSAVGIAYQLAIMQMLAITQWHHFAYMVISIALLGFGAAGTVVALFRRPLTENFDRVFPVLMFLCGATIAAAGSISQHEAVRFDSYLLFTDASQAIRLLLTYLLFFIPFFLAALAIGIAFTKHSNRIGVLYFWNLTGSGVGGLLGYGLVHYLPAGEVPAILALIAVLSGSLAVSGKPALPVLITAALALVLTTVSMVRPTKLVPSEFKDLSRAMQLPEARVTNENLSAWGVLQVVGSPALRFAPGLSLTYPEAVPVQRAVFNNGDLVGPLPQRVQNSLPAVMDFTTAALPYTLEQRRRALVLNMGTGMHVQQALDRKVESVTAIEPNPALIKLLAEELAGTAYNFLEHPRVNVVNMDSRAWLQMDPQTYDLIVLPTVGAFGGTSGISAIREDFLLTRSAVGEAWRKLTPQGVLSITCWMDHPPRQTLRILATFVEMLAEHGIEDPRSVVAAVRSWSTITFIVKKTPFSSAEIAGIRSFCRRLNFDPALLPDISSSERTFYNVGQDDLFFAALDRLLSSDREELYLAYDFNIYPATDDRPYFAQFMQLKSIGRLSEHFGTQAVPFLEIGYLIVFLTLAQTATAAFFLIIAPLIPSRLPGGGKTWIFWYFSGIGIGYIFVEMAMIQRFAFFFGNSLYAFAVVISVMLVASGIGSFVATRLSSLLLKPAIIFACLIMILIIHGFLLTPFLLATVGSSPVIKMLIAVFALFPPALLMGIPFPAGILMLRGKSEFAVPWAWGVNSCFSVVGASLATIVAVEAGFTVVMIIAALSYGCTWAASRLYRRAG